MSTTPVRLLFTPPMSFDIYEASRLVWDLLDAKALTVANARTGVSPATDEIGKRLREIFLNNYTVTDAAALKGNPELAAWQTDIADQLFPGEQLLTTPSTNEEIGARDRLLSLCWNWSSLALNSPLNRMIRGDGYFVAEQVVSKKRPAPGQKSGVGVPATGRFITEDYTLLRDLVLVSDLAKFDAAARRLDNALRDHGDRQPGFRHAIAKYSSTKVTGSMAKLEHADPKKMAALEAPDDGEDADEAKGQDA